MISDSIPSASIPMAASNAKDFAKKKRVNRSAKLKQCKLDARREQWLSQVKNKGGCKEEVNGVGEGTRGLPSLHYSEKKLEIKPRGDGENHFSDSESSPSNSPTSHTSSLLGSNDSGTNFTASSRSSRSSSSECYSGTMSEEDEGNVDDDDGCLDDWETVADALAANDKQEHSQDSELGSTPLEKHDSAQIHSRLEVTNQLLDVSKAKAKSGGPAPVNCRAWRADDTSRPQCLPNLSKQYSFPLSSERHLVGGKGSAWSCKKVRPLPVSCPICFEDLDGTDSSFLPCSCGFSICLFCHKRILEEDGRCPGCRKEYGHDNVEAHRLDRSCSMITRS